MAAFSPPGDPSHLEALLEAVERALVNEDRDEAAALCGEVLAARPGSPRAWIAAARVHASWARMDEARDLLDRAVGKFGARPEIRAEQIALARQSGDIDLRREWIEAAGDDARRCFPLWAESVRFAIDMGLNAEAEEALRSPPAASPQERAHARVLAGQLEEARGNYAEARAHFRKALELDPHYHFQVHVEMARTGLLSLDVPLARRHMERVIEANASTPAMGENPSSFSQSRIAAEVGQMLDELLLDETLPNRLQEIGLDPPDLQIAELEGLVVANPSHTTTAIQLLLALRRRGDLRDRVSPGAGAPRFGRIPKRIAQYWDPLPPPRDVAALMRNWINLNPDWEYRLFDDVAAAEFLRAHATPDALAAYRGAIHVAQRADIFRLAYLASEGGVYADADDRCLAPVASWAPPEASFVGYLELCGAVANNCLAAAPGHPVIMRALAGAIEAIERGENDRIWQSTGPGLLTRAFALAVAADKDRGAALLEESVILDLGALQRSVAIHCHLAYKKSGRHWARAELGRRDDT